MIISPSVSQVLRGIIHEMGGPFKDGLDPVKSAQIDTIIGVLGSCAMRADHQSEFIHQEANAIKSLGDSYVASGHITSNLKHSLSEIETCVDDNSLYQAASEALSAMSDIGASAGPDLSAQLFSLLEQRLANEAQIIGGGFEAAGRG